jgi:hypothetical protein
MSDGNQEFTDGKSSPYQEIQPLVKDAFAVAVTKVQEGNALTLTVLDLNPTIAQLRDLDPSLLNPFFNKGRSFLTRSLDTASDSTMSDEDRVSHLNSIFYSEVATKRR